MSEINVDEILRNDALATARQVLHDALFQINDDTCLPALEAIEALIDAKIAVAMEEMADRIQDASGIRP